MTPRMVLIVAREGIRAKSYKEAAITLEERFLEPFSPDLVRSVTDYVGAIVWTDDQEQALKASEWLQIQKWTGEDVPETKRTSL